MPSDWCWETVKSLPKLVYQGHEKIVEVFQTLLQETIVEVPPVPNVELTRQVPKPQTQKVPGKVAKPVIQVRERTVEVLQVTLREEIVKQLVVEYVDITKEPEVEYREPPHFELDTCPKRTVIVF